MEGCGLAHSAAGCGKADCTGELADVLHLIVQAAGNGQFEGKGGLAVGGNFLGSGDDRES